MTRIGDVIRFGQDIPPDVVRMTDRQAEDGAYWRRTAVDPSEFVYHEGLPGSPRGVETLHEEWFPFTVTETDGEPPAEISDIQRVRGALSRLGDEPSAVAAFERIVATLELIASRDA